MKRVRRRLLIPSLALAAPLAWTDAAGQDGAPLIIPSQSSVYNQTSVNLPAPPVAYGQDIVRAADGVSCQSSVASGGPYLDVGMIGSTDVFERQSQAIYGRVVMPLGRRSKRVDCTRLYELEIARMRLEMEVLRMGARTQALAPLEMSIAPVMLPAPTPAPIKTDAPPTSLSLPKSPPPPGLKPRVPTSARTPIAIARLERRRKGLR